MFAGMYRLSGDGTIAVLRIDLEPVQRTALYTLTDNGGVEHQFRYALGQSAKTFAEFMDTALLTYLVSCQETGWTGNCHIVQAPMGIDELSMQYLLSRFFFMATEQAAPPGVTIQ